jgi:hypothetical protein
MIENYRYVLLKYPGERWVIREEDVEFGGLSEYIEEFVEYIMFQKDSKLPHKLRMKEWIIQNHPELFL